MGRKGALKVRAVRTDVHASIVRMYFKITRLSSEIHLSCDSPPLLVDQRGYSTLPGMQFNATCVKFRRSLVRRSGAAVMKPKHQVLVLVELKNLC